MDLTPKYIILLKLNELIPATNFSYPSIASMVVLGVYLSAQAAFRLDRKSPANRQMYIASIVIFKANK